MFQFNRIKKDFFVFFVAVIYFSLWMFTFSDSAFAQENETTTWCYANKCYVITIDYPDLCFQGAANISFDSEGNSNFVTYTGGKFIGKQKEYKNKYFAKIDLNKDHKPDCIVALTFSDCGDSSCGKVNGKLTYMDQKGGILRKCGLDGFVVVCSSEPQSLTNQQPVNNPGNINGRVTDKTSGSGISGDSATHALAQEREATTRCYENKSYGITIDYPDLCFQRYIDIFFDSKGNSDLDAILGGKFIGKQRKSKNKYFAKVDRTNDDKPDLIFVLNFKSCGEDSCGKVNGKLTYIDEQGGIIRECALDGFVNK